MKRIINVVWCDDRIDSFFDESLQKLFDNNGLNLLAKAKTSNELIEYLIVNRNLVDAVIIDFNVSEDAIVPEEKEASGFRIVHDSLKDYISTTSFYLYSGCDIEFIRDKYKAYDIKFEGDYFFKKPNETTGDFYRYFNSGQIKELIDTLRAETEFKNTPTSQIRSMYPDAFQSIAKFNLDSEIFIRLLLCDKNIDRYDLCDKSNPLRSQIDKVFGIMSDNAVIPPVPLNAVKGIIGELGNNEDKAKYDPTDLMPASLVNALEFFLKYTQDGSHEKPNGLTIDFRKYLKEHNDIYLIKALTIICMDIIIWCDKFYNKYEDKKLFSRTPFVATIKEICCIKNKEGACLENNGKTYCLLQDNNNPLKKGDQVKVNGWVYDTFFGKDYFVRYKDWELVGQPLGDDIA